MGNILRKEATPKEATKRRVDEETPASATASEAPVIEFVPPSQSPINIYNETAIPVTETSQQTVDVSEETVTTSEQSQPVVADVESLVGARRDVPKPPPLSPLAGDSSDKLLAGHGHDSRSRISTKKKLRPARHKRRHGEYE